jgi:hypothetical protein
MNKGSEFDSFSAWFVATPFDFKQTAASTHTETELRHGF